jgi:hypothetical protein
MPRRAPAPARPQLQLQRRFGFKDRVAEDLERVKSEIDAGLRVEVRCHALRRRRNIAPQRGGAETR